MNVPLSLSKGTPPPPPARDLDRLRPRRRRRLQLRPGFRLRLGLCQLGGCRRRPAACRPRARRARSDEARRRRCDRGARLRLLPLQKVIARAAEHRVRLVLGATVGAGDHFSILRHASSREARSHNCVAADPYCGRLLNRERPSVSQEREPIRAARARDHSRSLRPDPILSTGAAAVLETDSTRPGSSAQPQGLVHAPMEISRREEGGIGE